MGYLIDPPNNRGRTLVEQLDELREFCNRLTVSLNETLNSLNTGNMDEATQKSFSAASAATLQGLQAQTNKLEQKLNEITANANPGTGGGGTTGRAEALDLLWEQTGEAKTMSYSEGFTLRAAAANYKAILVELTGTYAGMLILPINAGSFTYSCMSATNHDSVTTIAGTLRWEESWFKFYYQLRYYHTSASGGGSSSADPVVGRIYGMK